MEFQEVQSFGAAIHFWPNGAGPTFWEIFQEALFAEWIQGHFEKYPADSHGSCDPLLLAASWKMRLAESKLPLEWKLPGWYPQQVPEDRETERMD